MKFAKSIPKTDLTVQSRYFSEGWKKLKEPSNLLLSVMVSLPFMFICLMCNLIMLLNMNPSLFGFLKSGAMQFTFRIEHILFFLIGMYGYMFLHEMVHAMFIPGFRQSNKTLWGIRAGFGFVYTSEPISKCRFILISVMPYVLLSLVATVVASLAGIMNGYIAAILLLNAAGSCVDFLNVALIMGQVPKQATIVSNGSETYFS